MCVGHKPFQDDLEVSQYSAEKESIEVHLDEGFGEQCKKDVTRNISNMLRFEPSSRPNSSELFCEFSNLLDGNKHPKHFSPAELPKKTPTAHNTERQNATQTPAVNGRELPTDSITPNLKEIAAYEDALSKEPMNYWLWRDLCQILISKRSLQTAIERCERGVKECITSPSSLMMLSNLHAMNGDFKKAVPCSMQLFDFTSASLSLSLGSTGNYRLSASPNSIKEYQPLFTLI